MKLVYNGRKNKVFSNVAIPKPFEDVTGKGYFYLIWLYGYDKDNNFFKWLKGGITCNIIQRMCQHCGDRKGWVEILHISSAYSESTIRRIERSVRENLKNVEDFEFVRNDRFIIPENTEFEIKYAVRKEFTVPVSA